MERIYGPNLVGLHHPYTGKVDHKRFAQARTIPKQTYMNVDGVVFDADAWTAAVYGLTAGIQYTEVTKVGQPMSNCFFAASNVIDDFEQINLTINNLHSTRGEFDWFDILIYGPIHVLGDFTVSFEHCEFSKFGDVIADIGSLDWGLIADRGVALGMDIGLNWQVYYDTAMRALGWYTPPWPKECNPDDFTVDGTLNEKAFEKCLTMENDKLKEIEEYLSVIDYCILKHANDLLEAELLEEELAKASIPNLNSVEKGDNKDDGADNNNQDFRAKLRQGSDFDDFGDDVDAPEDEGETIISELTGFESNTKKDELCDTKYGKIAETNFYDLGLFGGKAVSKIFAQQTIS